MCIREQHGLLLYEYFSLMNSIPFRMVDLKVLFLAIYHLILIHLYGTKLFKDLFCSFHHRYA
jgi:hypothetical protein